MLFYYIYIYIQTDDNATAYLDTRNWRERALTIFKMGVNNHDHVLMKKKNYKLLKVKNESKFNLMVFFEFQNYFTYYYNPIIRNNL